MITTRLGSIVSLLAGAMLVLAPGISPTSAMAGPELSVRLVPAKRNWVTSSSPRVRFRLPGLKPAYFTCRVDGGPPKRCKPRTRLKNLKQGRHRLRITAFTEEGEQLATTRKRFKLDSLPPQTRIIVSPKARIETLDKKAPARIRIAKGSEIRRLQCQVDWGRWFRCHRKVTIESPPGRHQIRVRAIDRAGNRDPSPATRRWHVKRWEPDLASARRYANQRPGVVTFAVDVGWRTQGRMIHRRAKSASTVKVLLMAAYLRRQGVRDRNLKSSERRRIEAMIRYSDNGSATTIRNIVGGRAVRKVARAGGMNNFGYSPIWGACKVSARDFAAFMRNVEQVIPRRHRAFALRQLRKITGYQRWGVGKIVHHGWDLNFKGGWGISDGRYGGVVSHQVAVLRRGKWRIGLAILTQGNSSVDAGNRTLKGLASRLLKGLPGKPSKQLKQPTASGATSQKRLSGPAFPMP